MKKNPTKKKASAKKPARVWKSGHGQARAKEAKARVKAQKQPALIPGLRIKALDKLCEQISDTRAAMNRLRGEETDLERHAHKEMQEHGQMTWSAAGVELARVPGDEKLRVRTIRETSTTQAPEEFTGEIGSEE